jgi:hypothetical protein
VKLDALEGKALAATEVPDGCDIIAFDGSVRSSKTVSSLLMWAEFVMSGIRYKGHDAPDGPEGMLAIIGRTETAAINNIVKPLQDIFGTHRVVLNRGLGVCTLFGREIQLYGANNAEAVTKIQGATLAGAYVDEATNIPEEFFNMLRSRLSVAGAKLFLTCNPDGPKHWLLRNWLSKARWWLDRDGKVHFRADGLPIWRVTFLLDDNLALLRNNPKFVADLKASWAPGSVFYRRYIRSEWVSAEGSVYGDVWNEDRVTFRPEDLTHVDQVLMAGLDYGTDHPTRGYLLGMVRVNFRDDGTPDWSSAGKTLEVARMRTVLVVLDEFAPDTATVGEHARQFEMWLARNRHWGEPMWLAIDPAAAVFKAELFALGHADVMNAHNAVVNGIQVVSSLLYAGALYISTACTKLREMLPNYMWDKKATDRGATAPIKENDDEADALRYAVYTSRRYWRDHIPLAALDTPDLEEAAA